MAPILYYLPPSPPCRSILLLGKMIDLEFDLKVVNIMEGEHMKSEFIQMNPQHCIPTMDDNGLILWESRAILAYLVAQYANDDALYPKAIRTRAVVDQRLQFDLGTLYHRMTEYYFPTMFMGAPLDEPKKAKLTEALGWLEIILKGHSWVAADNFTIADLSLCVTVSQIEAFGYELGPYPRLRTWLQSCKEEMEPFGYQDINQAGCDQLAEMFNSKLKRS